MSANKPVTPFDPAYQSQIVPFKRTNNPKRPKLNNAPAYSLASIAGPEDEGKRARLSKAKI